MHKTACRFNVNLVIEHQSLLSSVVALKIQEIRLTRIALMSLYYDKYLAKCDIIVL